MLLAARLRKEKSDGAKKGEESMENRIVQTRDKRVSGTRLTGDPTAWDRLAGCFRTADYIGKPRFSGSLADGEIDDALRHVGHFSNY